MIQQKQIARSLWFAWIGFLTFVELNLTVFLTRNQWDLFYAQGFLIFLAIPMIYFFRYVYRGSILFVLLFLTYEFTFGFVTVMLMDALFPTLITNTAQFAILFCLMAVLLTYVPLKLYVAFFINKNL